MKIPGYFRYTSLPRDIDLALVEHRWMIALAMVASLAAGTQSVLAGASSILPVAGAGLSGGASVFLAWAIGREMDPDHPPSALVGGAIGGATMLVWGAPSILVSGWVLVLLRLVARTTGLAPRPFDTLILIGVSLGLGLVRGSDFILLAATGLALDGWLAPVHRNHRFAAAGLGFAWLATVFAQFSPSSVDVDLAILVWVGLGVIAVAFLALTLSRWEVEAQADRTPEPLKPRRVHAGQVLGVLLALGLPMARGSRGLLAQSALWAAMAGIAVFHMVWIGVSAVRGRKGPRAEKVRRARPE